MDNIQSRPNSVMLTSQRQATPTDQPKIRRLSLSRESSFPSHNYLETSPTTDSSMMSIQTQQTMLRFSTPQIYHESLPSIKHPSVNNLPNGRSQSNNYIHRSNGCMNVPMHRNGSAGHVQNGHMQNGNGRMQNGRSSREVQSSLSYYNYLDSHSQSMDLSQHSQLSVHGQNRGGIPRRSSLGVTHSIPVGFYERRTSTVDSSQATEV